MLSISEQYRLLPLLTSTASRVAGGSLRSFGDANFVETDPKHICNAIARFNQVEGVSKSRYGSQLGRSLQAAIYLRSVER
jgi:hypothetical protein